MAKLKVIEIDALSDEIVDKIHKQVDTEIIKNPSTWYKKFYKSKCTTETKIEKVYSTYINNQVKINKLQDALDELKERQRSLQKNIPFGLYIYAAKESSTKQEIKTYIQNTIEEHVKSFILRQYPGRKEITRDIILNSNKQLNEVLNLICKKYKL